MRPLRKHGRLNHAPPTRHVSIYAIRFRWVVTLSLTSFFTLATTTTMSQPSQSQNAGGIDADGDVRCGCGDITLRRVSGPSSKNPGRAYYTCVSFPPEKKCKFFVWEDSDPAYLQLSPAHRTSTSAGTAQSAQAGQVATRTPQSSRTLMQPTTVPIQPSSITPAKRSRPQTPPPAAHSSVHRESALDASRDALGAGLQPKTPSSHLTPDAKRRRLLALEEGVRDRFAPQPGLAQSRLAAPQFEERNQNDSSDEHTPGSQSSQERKGPWGSQPVQPAEPSVEPPDVAVEPIIKQDPSEEDRFFAAPARTSRPLYPYRLPGLSQESSQAPRRPRRTSNGDGSGLPTPQSSQRRVGAAQDTREESQEAPDTPTRDKGKRRADGISGPTWSRVQAESLSETLHSQETPSRVDARAEGSGPGTAAAARSAVEHPPELVATIHFVHNLMQQNSELTEENRTLKAQVSTLKETLRHLL